MFSLDQLVTLRTVVEEGTVAAAADQLGLTASAVSQQLARLEKEAGQELMRRQGRNIVPTDAAEVLVEAAAEMMAVEQRARADLERLLHDVSGPVTVASFPSALRGLTAPATAVLRERYPGVVPTLTEKTPDEGVAAVARGDVDLAIVHDWTGDHLEVPPGVMTTLIGTDPCDLMVPAGHPLAERTKVSVRELDGQEWIVDAPGIWTRYLLQSLHNHELSYRISCYANEHASQIRATELGLGLALVPHLGRALLPDSVVTIPLTNAPTRRVLAATRRDSSRRPVLEALLGILVEVWADD